MSITVVGPDDSTSIRHDSDIVPDAMRAHRFVLRSVSKESLIYNNQDAKAKYDEQLKVEKSNAYFVVEFECRMDRIELGYQSPMSTKRVELSYQNVSLLKILIYDMFTNIESRPSSCKSCGNTSIRSCTKFFSGPRGADDCILPLNKSS